MPRADSFGTSVCAEVYEVPVGNIEMLGISSNERPSAELDPDQV